MLTPVLFDPSSKDPRSSKFIQDFRAKFNQDPGESSATGYASVQLIEYALTQGATTRQQVIKQLAEGKNMKTILGPITFDENGDPDDVEFSRGADRQEWSVRQRNDKQLRARVDVPLPFRTRCDTVHAEPRCPYFLQQLINGISVGAVYALIAVGFSLVYGVLNLVNFAHGDVLMAASFLTVDPVRRVALAAGPGRDRRYRGRGRHLHARRAARRRGRCATRRV